jgi:hypothetical protein
MTTQRPQEADLIERARARYEGRNANVGPSWEQLGDTTRSVWIDETRELEKVTTNAS